ncbi:MAG: type II secretion system minor pseudopilin GspI [Pseudomonadota bacterium]
MQRPEVIDPAAEKGFTLLEVLVALTILAIAFAAAVQSVSHAAFTLQALQDRTEANALLSERLAEWRAADTWPATGQERQIFLANERDWFWSRDVQISPDPDIRQVQVEVGLDENQIALVTRTAYFRRAGHATKD